MGALRNLWSWITLPFSLSKVLFRVDKRALRKFLSSTDPGLLKAMIKLVNELGPDLTAKLLTNYLYFAGAMHEKLSQFVKSQDLEKLSLPPEVKRGIEGLATGNPELMQAIGAFVGMVVGRTLKKMLESQEFKRELCELIKNVGLLWEETYRIPRE
jgi:hypothetical protein